MLSSIPCTRRSFARHLPSSGLQLHRAPMPEEEPLEPLPGEEPTPDEEEPPPHPDPSLHPASSLQARRSAAKMASNALAYHLGQCGNFYQE